MILRTLFHDSARFGYRGIREDPDPRGLNPHGRKLFQYYCVDDGMSQGSCSDSRFSGLYILLKHHAAKQLGLP